MSLLADSSVTKFMLMSLRQRKQKKPHKADYKKRVELDSTGTRQVHQAVAVVERVS